jgi:hypothetical protein
VRIGSGGVGGGGGGRDLRIVSAVYGVSGCYRDVAPQLKAMIRADRLSVQSRMTAWAAGATPGTRREEEALSTTCGSCRRRTVSQAATAM